MEVKFASHTFNGKDQLSDEHKECYKNLVALHVVELGKEMKLNNLEYIIVPDNYKEELFEFQKQNGVSQYSTDDDSGRGVAQAVSYYREGNEYQTIFISKELVLFLVDQDTLMRIEASNDEEFIIQFYEQRQLSINTLHHELSHVHEHLITNQIPWISNLNFDNDLLMHQLRQRALLIWQEYFACRFSSNTHLISSTDTSYIIDLCTKYEMEVRDCRQKYNLCQIELDEFVIMLHKRINSLFYFSSHSLGNFFSITDKEKRDDYRQEVEDGLSKLLYKSHWLKLDSILNNLYLTYPHWQSVEELDGLCDLIIEYISEFDVHISNIGESLYYDIPVPDDWLE